MLSYSTSGNSLPYLVVAAAAAATERLAWAPVLGAGVAQVLALASTGARAMLLRRISVGDTLQVTVLHASEQKQE